MRYGYFVTITHQISTWLPNSTTRLLGNLKNSIALAALPGSQKYIVFRQHAQSSDFSG